MVSSSIMERKFKELDEPLGSNSLSYYVFTKNNAWGRNPFQKKRDPTILSKGRLGIIKGGIRKAYTEKWGGGREK